MKYLLVFAVLAVAFYVWRAGRRDTTRNPPTRKPAASPGKPQDMVRCASCGVHLPRGDALPGPDGAVYCSEEHRQLGRR
ncbi:MAG: PP0621 family protein [Ramlibacter sp.]